MNIDRVIETFISESLELLEDMEARLLEFEGTSDRQEAVNAIFRTAHTIKGSAGVVRLDHIVSFTHVVEGVLVGVRDGRTELGPDLIELLLAAGDHIRVLVEAAAAGHLDSDAAGRGAPLVERLRAFQGATQAAPPAVQAAARPERPADSETWHIALRLSRDVLRHGMDPLSFISFLDTLGTVRSIAVVDELPRSAEQMDPESCYLGFDISLASSAGQAAIEGVFELLGDDCTVVVAPASTPAPEPAEPQASERRPPTSEARQEQHTRLADGRTIRVDAGKLDRLINLVGELIIAAASAELIGRRAQMPDLQEATSSLSTLVEELRDSALQLRMVKIGATFNRFHRVVHDVAHELGKDIRLALSGEETELDKTVVEKLGDPLLHLVRNAIDHGIEPASVRLERGKPAHGTVGLHAYHDSGNIVIEVSDDGGGLDRERTIAVAAQRGVIEPGRTLSDQDVAELIFEPGFSTASQVTNLSGRGVGLDVVKRNVTALRGSIDVRSEPGAGMVVSVRLPLTLAIIDGFLVGVGSSVFVVPLDMIEECVELNEQPGRDYINLRGRILPFVRLRELFRTRTAPPRRASVVVIKCGGEKVGLVVDSLLGEFQTVIKPLGRLFSGVRCISGSTILGTGEVALILDVPALIQDRLRGDACDRQLKEEEDLRC